MCETPKMFCPRKFSLHPPCFFIGAFVSRRRCVCYNSQVRCICGIKKRFPHVLQPIDINSLQSFSFVFFQPILKTNLLRNLLKILVKKVSIMFGQ